LDPVRIACVRYLNTAPLIEGLDRLEGLELLPAVPSKIADLLASGAAELGLCSVVDAARSPVPLTLLPVGMIGCDGPTLTVRLFSRVPWDKVATLHADTDSHTSVALARLVLAQAFGVRPSVADFDAGARAALDPWPEAVLLIGDKVVTHHPPTDLYTHQLDLGEAWKTLTGLPFVYAAWMCRTVDLQADGPRAARIRHAALLLDRQRRHNATRLGMIVQKRALAAGWPLELAATYLGELLRFDVGSREREALTRFFADAARMSILPGYTPDWLDLGIPVLARGASSVVR
jgi:chorismate dehydratase